MDLDFIEVFFPGLFYTFLFSTFINYFDDLYGIPHHLDLFNGNDLQLKSSHLANLHLRACLQLEFEIFFCDLEFLILSIFHFHSAARLFDSWLLLWPLILQHLLIFLVFFIPHLLGPSIGLETGDLPYILVKLNWIHSLLWFGCILWSVISRSPWRHPRITHPLGLYCIPKPLITCTCSILCSFFQCIDSWCIKSIHRHDWWYIIITITKLREP